MYDDGDILLTEEEKRNQTNTQYTHTDTDIDENSIIKPENSRVGSLVIL